MSVKPIHIPESPVKYFKVFFVIILVIAGFIFVKYRKAENSPVSVLGENQVRPIAFEGDLKETAQILSNNITQKTQDVVGDILGQVASKSSETVTDFLFEKTAGQILLQIHKLPDRQQEQVREIICK